jgi:hypothetical protein
MKICSKLIRRFIGGCSMGYIVTGIIMIGIMVGGMGFCKLLGLAD